MTGPDLTAGEQHHHRGLDDTARTRCTPPNGPHDHGDSTPGQQQQQQQQQQQHSNGLQPPPLDEADSTPRSEAPSDVAAVNASLRAAVVDCSDEPSYFSPQPRRTYSSTITRSTPASSEPSPASSANASTTSVHHITGTSLGDAFGPSLHPLNRPAYERDLSSISTASNVTVRAHPAAPLHHLASEPAVAQQRHGPVYPNQSYAALQFQQYPTPYIPPIQRARSSHPAHFSANSVSSIPSFGASNLHYRDIMDSAPRTAGNSPISSPGLFDPSRHMGTSGSKEPTDGLYASPWLHHTHRQAPKESHLADVTHDPVSGRKVVNQYEIIDELGRGVHGKVKLGKDLMSGKYVAIKIVDRYSKRRRLGKNTSHEDKIKREIAILKKARHPNIVSLLEVIDDPAKKKVYIVLEHVELGEVKWRTEGAPEVTLVEWRRFQRESEGIFDDDRAAREDERIIRRAHQKLVRQRRREAREAHLRRQTITGNEPWSFEFGGDSDDDMYSETGRSSRASNREDRPHSRVQFHEKQDASAHTDDTMETAFCTSMLAPGPQGDDNAVTGLEGTMYGAYDTELTRGRTASVADSSSSHPDGEHEEVPEHFRYVPLMTIHGAWEAFKDTVLGLEYLHYQNVIHRDIKPANLLVTKEHRIKISDFGVSYLGRQKTDEGVGDQSENEMQEEDEAIELAKTVGTPAFYAPELCRTDFSAETPHIDGGIDVWALGITLYCLVYGRVPFHENNPFALMKAISENEPYIPRYRLKPVSERANSRPNSHGRNMQPIANAKRAPHDVDYEEIDENLRDLLKCLLVKDPKHRITIHEIKRHPWLLQGLNNYNTWMEETDPDRSSQGRKIEITDDDLEKAVVPVGLVERMRSAAKKATDYVTKSFTRGGSNSRRRAQSSAHDLPASMSTTSSSSTISQDARRGSIAPNAILDMLGRSRDEHPLSHSVTASPEAKERARYFESPDSRNASPMQNSETYRPAMADRSASSVYTIRQSILETRSTSPLVPSALPGTPTALDTPTGSHLSGLFGGLPRRVVNSMKSKDKLRPPRDHTRKKSFDRSIDRLMVGEQDPHGVPSLALSTASAAGHVDAPDLREMSPGARSRSPSYSDAHSADRLDSSSRQSSISSLSSRLASRWAAANELEVGPILDIPVGSYKSATSSRSAHTANSHWLSSAHETSDERFSRAKDEFIRRRVHEEKISSERSVSATQRSGFANDNTACPPSPDDETYNQRQQELSQQQKVEEYLGTQHTESSENSPVGGQERGLAFCSSEEQFTPMSQSTSNPSIPSVASASSSVPEDCAHLDQFARMLPTASADSISHNQFDAPLEDSAGYDGDHAVDSDEDDSSDDDGGLFMGRKKPAPKPRRTNSISNAELARSNISKEVINSRRRSARSGSNGTVKKIPPPGAADPSATTPIEHASEA